MEISYDVKEWKYFITYLKKRAKYLNICFPEEEEKEDLSKKSKSKQKKSSESAAEIIERKDRERREKTINSIDEYFEDEEQLKLNPSRKYGSVTLSIFILCKWGIQLYRHIDESFAEALVPTLLDCICSLSRMRADISHFPTYVLSAIDTFINDFKKRFLKRNQNKMDKIMNALFSHERLFIESSWEKMKPSSRELYSEQKEIYRLLSQSLQNGKNQPLFATYKVSPGSGKTFLAAVLGALMAAGHAQNKLDETLNQAIHAYERKECEKITLPKNYIPQGCQKILLYSCYNVQVRNMVSGLCRDADVPFWVASSYLCEKSHVMKTTLRPYRTMYEDFKHYLKSRSDPMRQGSMDEQWIFNLEHTNRDPAIIIADPESCSVLLDAYPERFVGYFDEVTAGAEEGITSGFARHTCALLMKAPRQTILLSATLQNMEQLEWCRKPFMERHQMTLPPYADRVFTKTLPWSVSYAKTISKIRKMDFTNFFFTVQEPIFQEVKSSRLLISCTAYAPRAGFNTLTVYMPHMHLKSIDELDAFLKKLKDDSALVRMYSPEAVYHMVDECCELIPTQFQFDTYFKEYGMVKHESIRDYIYALFQNILDTQNVELFDAMRTYVKPLLSEKEIKHNITVSQEKILTYNAYMYDSGKVIQVSTSSRMPEYIQQISTELLEGSPSVETLLANYREEERILEEKLAQVKMKEGGKRQTDGDKEDTRRMGSFKANTKELEERKMDIEEKYAPKLRYPRKYLVNSLAHYQRFVPEGVGAKIADSSNMMMSKDTLQKCVEREMNETLVKLFMGGVAIRDVARMNGFEKGLYERSTRMAKFFISDSSIVYGTNIKNVNCISVTSDYAASTSSTRNSIYQLMGRAGRSGQSDSAKIIFHSLEGVEKLFGDENEEAHVMEAISRTL
jgi:hypothetical protein